MYKQSNSKGGDSKQFFARLNAQVEDIESRFKDIEKENLRNRYYTDDSIKDFKSFNKPRFPWIYPIYNPFLPLLRKKKPKVDHSKRYSRLLLLF